MRLVLGMAVVVAMLSARPADACSCRGRPSACEALASGIVFVGTPTKTSSVHQQDLVTFDVSEVFSGTLGKTVEVMTSPMACGIKFVVGTTYLVYADASDTGTIHAWGCSRTAPVAYATEDLAIARAVPTAKHELATVEGTVILVDDPIRTPKAGIEVRVRGAQITAKTSKKGVFKLRVPPGTHTLELVSQALRVKGGKTIEIAVASPLVCPKPVIDVAWNGRIAGRLTDGADRPAAGVTVVAGPRDDPRKHRTARTGADGRYVVEELAAGTYEVGVSTPRYGGVSEYSPIPTTRYGKDVVVGRGGLTPDIDFAVPERLPLHRLDGVVRAHDGTRIEGAVVRVVWNAGRNNSFFTNGGGGFDVEVLTGSTVRVSACWHQAPGGPRCTTKDVTKKIERPTSVDLWLPR